MLPSIRNANLDGLYSSYCRQLMKILLFALMNAFNPHTAQCMDEQSANHAVESAQQESFKIDTAITNSDMTYAKELSSRKLSTKNVEFAQQANDRQKIDLEELHKTAAELEFLTGKLPATGEGCKDGDCGAQILNTDFQQDSRVQGSSLVVFVSFSMPKASLVELSDQSLKYNATLVLRGICEGSFLKTKEKILEINPNGLRLDIHPDLFKQYDIKRVPTFVLVKNGKEVSRLSGNVTLEFASSKLMEGQ